MSEFEQGAEAVEQFIPGIYRDVPEAIQEIFHRMPFGQKCVIGGRAAEIKPLSKEPSEVDGQWRFIFDVVFDRGSPDHLEFTVTHTGGGGAPIAATYEPVESET